MRSVHYIRFLSRITYRSRGGACSRQLVSRPTRGICTWKPHFTCAVFLLSCVDRRAHDDSVSNIFASVGANKGFMSYYQHLDSSNLLFLCSFCLIATFVNRKCFHSSQKTFVCSTLHADAVCGSYII